MPSARLQKVSKTGKKVKLSPLIVILVVEVRWSLACEHAILHECQAKRATQARVRALLPTIPPRLRDCSQAAGPCSRVQSTIVLSDSKTKLRFGW